MGNKTKNVKMKSVLHVINDLKLGGAQKLVSDLIIESKDEYRFSIFILDSSNGLFDKILNEERIEILSLYPISLNKILKIIRRLKSTDLIHVHLFPLLYLCSFIPIKKVYTEHNTWNRRRKYNLLMRIERFIYSNYDAVISISNKTKDALDTWLNRIPTNYNDVIYNGINLNKFTKKPLGIFGYRLGMMGRFSAQKDQATILHALKYLPEEFSVIFAGSGELLNNIKSLSQELNINRRVKFLGQITNIENYLNNIDLYIQSSNWEGFGLAPLEAMSKQIPTIGSNVDGLDEVIGSSDYLFKKDNPKDLAKSIMRIYNTDNSYMDAQKFAYARAKEFSIDIAKEKYSQLYSLIINQ
jgi:glycosyltransferase involved in cell wall biosynthesis